MKKSVLVTGASGFIGRALVEHLLHEGWSVFAMTRSGRYPISHTHLEVVKGDMRDKKSLTLATRQVAYIVHLASAKQDEVDSYDTNVLGTQNLVDASKENNVELIVNISTISTKIPRRGVYGSTKNEADEIIRKSNIPYVILKPSVVYGDLEHGVFGSMVKFSRRLPIVPVFGSGECVFRPVYIGDVVKVIEKSLVQSSLHNKVYDLVGPDQVSFNSLLRIVGTDLLNKKVRIVHVPIPVGIFLAHLLGLFFYRPPITKSNILGSTQDADMDYSTFSKDFEYKPIGIQEGIERIKSKYVVYDEATLVLKYISSRSLEKIEIGQREIDLYNAVTEKAGISKSFDTTVFSYPFLLGQLDFISLFYKDSTLSKKLYIASAVLECSPVSASWLLPKKRSIYSIGIVSIYLGASFMCKAITSIPLFLFPNFIQRNVK